MITLSIRQPWAWLIVNGHKPVENRDWKSSYRGPLLIHAGKARVRKHHEEALQGLLYAGIHVPVPPFEELERGGIVGMVRMVDCVEHHESPYFTGPYAFVLDQAQRLRFHPCPGQLKFFDVRGDAEGLQRVKMVFTTGRADFLRGEPDRRFWAVKQRSEAA